MLSNKQIVETRGMNRVVYIKELTIFNLVDVQTGVFVKSIEPIAGCVFVHCNFEMPETGGYLEFWYCAEVASSYLSISWTASRF
jgi:hypothetical protein